MNQRSYTMESKLRELKMYVNFRTICAGCSRGV
jgi:hypothetical protein